MFLLASLRASPQTGVAIRILWRVCVEYSVYILANKTNVTIYTGVTNNLERRLWEHRNHVDPSSFTARYHGNKLVYFEMTPDAETAIAREKQIKSWSRKKKNRLIETKNPNWNDLWETDCRTSVRTGEQ